MSDDISVGTIEIEDSVYVPNVQQHIQQVLEMLDEAPIHKPPQLERAKQILRECLED